MEYKAAMKYASYLIDSFSGFRRKSIRCEEDGFIAEWDVLTFSWVVMRRVYKREYAILDCRSVIIYRDSLDEAKKIARRLPGPYMFKLWLEGRYSCETLPIATYWPMLSHKGL